MTLVYLALGCSLLALGVVVRYVIKALRGPADIDKTVSDPILLDDWDLPKK